jgi:hypothetical protein
MWIKDLQLANVDFEVDWKKVPDYFARRGGDIIEFGEESPIYVILFQQTHVSSLFGGKRMRSLMHYKGYPHLELAPKFIYRLVLTT